MSRRRAAVLLACLLLGLLLGGGQGTYALLNDDASVRAAGFSTGRILTPTAPRVTALLTARTIAWDATTVETGAGAQAVTGYQVYRYDAMTGGTATLVCPTTTQTTCNATNQPTVGYYAVRAVFGTAWTAESSRTVAGDTTAPTLVHTYPVNNTSSPSSPLSAKITNDCGSGVACGTASDNVSVATVTYQLQRSMGTLGLTLSCWNGSSWVAGACGLTTYLTATVTTSGGVTKWVVPGTSTVAYPNGTPATFTLRMRATDGSGNQGTSTITYTAT